MTPKQQRFVEEYCSNGFNATQAAISAGYSEHTASEIGRQNLGKLEIASAIKEFQAKNAAKAEITVESLTKELEKDRALARNLDQPSAAVSATNSIAKLHGLLTEDRKNNRTPLHDFAEWMNERGRDKPRSETTH